MASSGVQNQQVGLMWKRFKQPIKQPPYDVKLTLWANDATLSKSLEDSGAASHIPIMRLLGSWPPMVFDFLSVGAEFRTS